MEVLGEIKKNSKEKFIVSINEYEGHKYIDVRVYYQDREGEYKPTKKGIALSPKVVKEVMELVIVGAEKLQV
tara:strand:+ start:5160 stop:5375 length:216 start_codon:yes stop_codon:yes gene_type:complete